MYVQPVIASAPAPGVVVMVQPVGAQLSSQINPWPHQCVIFIIRKKVILRKHRVLIAVIALQSHHLRVPVLQRYCYHAYS